MHQFHPVSVLQILFKPKGAVIIYGWGHKFQCKPSEGGGQNSSAQAFEGQPEATKIYPKIFVAADMADILQYRTLICQANFVLS